MKNYNYSDIHQSGELRYLNVDREHLVNDPLWYHKRNLLQTATGFGRKLVTENKIRFNGRLHRIYCCIYSNSGTCYILDKLGWIIIN